MFIEDFRLSKLISTNNDLFGDFDFGETNKLFLDRIGTKLARDEIIKV